MSCFFWKFTLNRINNIDHGLSIGRRYSAQWYFRLKFVFPVFWIPTIKATKKRYENFENLTSCSCLPFKTTFLWSGFSTLKLQIYKKLYNFNFLKFRRVPPWASKILRLREPPFSVYIWSVCIFCSIFFLHFFIFE